MNLIDVTQNFKSDDDCLAYMESMRWPDGIKCPTCGSAHISKITRKTASKNKRTRIYQCLEKCTMNKKGEMVNAQFSATSGTLFNDSHLSLQKWFMAVAIVVDAKKGVSANQLKEHLGIGSYRTSWYMSHRIRKAMAESAPTKMKGIVEMDETWIAGKSKRRGPQKPRTRDMVIGLREREGRVRFFHVADAKKETVRAIINHNIRTDVKQIVTDQAVVYDFALDKMWQNKHRTVNHSTHWVSPAGVHTNTIESAFSLLKRGLIGSFHRVSIEHLHRYLSEFEWRFNERKAEDRFSMTLRRMVRAEAMPYAVLTEPI